MVTTTDAYDAGRRAALAGQPLATCPWKTAQGSPDRPLAFAFRRGFAAGEVEQGDVDGDLFRGVAK